MTEIDIADDDSLRFVQRVLESAAAPYEDRKAARDMVVAIRTRVRKEHHGTQRPYDLSHGQKGLKP